MLGAFVVVENTFLGNAAKYFLIVFIHRDFSCVEMTALRLLEILHLLKPTAPSCRGTRHLYKRGQLLLF
jgi:hypothetical protein